MMDQGWQRILVGGVVLMMLLPVFALAQYGEQDGDEGSSGQEFDAIVAPLVVPTADDFAAPQDQTEGVAASPLGIDAYVDVTSDIKSGVLTPFYRFSPALAFKAHIPLIFNYTRHYFGFDAEASGLGDIVLDAEYTKRMPSSGAEFRFQGSVKLPTGDENKTDTDEFGWEVPVPLGTGEIDYMARVQYARSSVNTGIIVSALYRLNASHETVTDLGFGGLTMTNNVSSPNLGVVSLFARRRVGGKWWLNLGASTLLTGSGSVETTWSDATPASDSSLDQGGTLVDLFPGISYDLGAIKPFIGARVPVVTSYDNDFRDDNRDTAIIFQLSYRPRSLTE